MRQWQQPLQLAANPYLRICSNVMPGVISKISQRVATSSSRCESKGDAGKGKRSRRQRLRKHASWDAESGKTA
jgi:hypothetical protein